MWVAGILRLVLLAIATLLVASAAHAEEFRYSVPKGFVDLSPGAPMLDGQAVPVDRLARAKKFRSYAFATDDAGTPIAEVAVDISGATGTEQDARDETLAKAERINRAFDFRVLRREIVKIAGVDCSLFEYAITPVGGELRTITYGIPLGSERAWIVLTVSAEHMNRVRPAFEASIVAVRGATPSQNSREGWKWVAIVGFALLAGCAIAQGASRSRKSKRSRV